MFLLTDGCFKVAGCDFLRRIATGTVVQSAEDSFRQSRCALAWIEVQQEEGGGVGWSAPRLPLQVLAVPQDSQGSKERVEMLDAPSCRLQAAVTSAAGQRSTPCSRWVRARVGKAEKKMLRRIAGESKRNEMLSGCRRYEEMSGLMR